jgi:hypothetical protein
MIPAGSSNQRNIWQIYSNHGGIIAQVDYHTASGSDCHLTFNITQCPPVYSCVCSYDLQCFYKLVNCQRQDCCQRRQQVIYTFSQASAPPTWVIDPESARTLPPTTVEPTSGNIHQTTEPPTSLDDTNYCKILDSALTSIDWSNLHPEIPQVNISVPLIGKIGLVMSNLQIQGPVSFSGCTVSNSGSGYLVSFPKLDCKVTNADWDWFMIHHESDHHKGNATADFSADFTFTVDPNTNRMANVDFSSQDFTIHVDGDHEQWLYSLAFSALGDKVKNAISQEISYELISKINACLPNPSSCS